MRNLLMMATFAVCCGCATPYSGGQTSSQVSQQKAGAHEVSLSLDPAGKNVEAKSFLSGKELLNEVNRLGGVRGEYETNAAFSKRMEQFGNFSVRGEVLASQIKFDRVTGEFFLEASMGDAQGFGFRSNSRVGKDPKIEYPSYQLSEDIYSEGQYVGQNSFGASASIEKRRIDRYYLVFSAVPKTPGKVVFYKVTGKLKITAAEMEKERENIRIVFTVMPTPDYLQTAKHFGTPTISNPYESQVNDYFFQAKVFWVTIVNIKSGKVYDDEARLSLKIL